MAGLGAKLFTAFSKLTAAQVTGYLMDQSIMRFASAAVRDAAFGGVGEPTLAEGMFCYLDDTNVLQSYTGSAWVTVASSSQPNGLVLIKSTPFTSGVNTTTVTGVFSNDFTSYRVVIENTVMTNTGTGTAIYCKMHDGTNPASTNYNFGLARIDIAASTIAGVGSALNTVGVFVGRGTGDRFGTAFDVVNPFLATHTLFPSVAGQNVSTGYMYIGTGMHQTSTSYSGFQIVADTGNFTSGTILVYGYRNQL
jgi:hypothetical protein